MADVINLNDFLIEKELNTAIERIDFDNLDVIIDVQKFKSSLLHGFKYHEAFKINSLDDVERYLREAISPYIEGRKLGSKEIIKENYDSYKVIYADLSEDELDQLLANKLGLKMYAFKTIKSEVLKEKSND